MAHGMEQRFDPAWFGVLLQERAVPVHAFRAQEESPSEMPRPCAPAGSREASG